MSKLEKMLEKAGLLIKEEPLGSMDSVNTPIQKNEKYAATQVPQNFSFTPGNETREIVAGDVISQAYSTLPSSEDDIVEIIENLLKNFEMLPDNQKPAVVVGTLQTMGKDIGKFIMEAETKKTALANAIAKYVQKVENEVAQLDATIKDAEDTISRCKQEQLDKKNDLENQKKAVTEEAKRLEKIITILGGK